MIVFYLLSIFIVATLIVTVRILLKIKTWTELTSNLSKYPIALYKQTRLFNNLSLIRKYKGFPYYGGYGLFYLMMMSIV